MRNKNPAGFIDNFGFYRENEIQYLMTSSNCFLLVQSYQENQKKISNLKSELKQKGFFLQKLPGISLSKADSIFINRSPWIPVTNSNLIIYTTRNISNTELAALVQLIKQFDALPLFCKNKQTVLDSQRLSLIGQMSEKTFSLQRYLFQNATLPILHKLTKTLFFLFQKKLSQKNNI